MKQLYLVAIFIAILAISGCVTVEKVVRERVDQAISGNRGYLQGGPSEEPLVEKSRTREYIDVRVELPTMEELTDTVSGAKKKGEAPSGKIETSVEPKEAYIPAPAPAEKKAEEESKYIK